jgi:hypothetical protein
MSKNAIKGKPKASAEERRPMHLRLSDDERCQLNRVASRLELSPSATLRFLVNAEDQRSASDASVDMMTLTFAGLFFE